MYRTRSASSRIVMAAGLLLGSAICAASQAARPMVKEGTASVKAVDLRDGAVSALSACQPYTMLPPEKYKEWKVIDLTFTPRDFSS